jgi:uncharacterized RDD family membrane protein YckC
MGGAALARWLKQGDNRDAARSSIRFSLWRRNLSKMAQALSESLLPPPSGRRLVKMSDGHEHTEITIDTLSTPPVKIKPAPIVRRITAAVIDSFVLTVAWLILSLGLGLNLAHLATAVYFPFSSSLATVAFLYYFLREGLFAATIGKSVTKLTVLEKNGDVCSFGAFFWRNLVRFVDWLALLYIVGAIAVLASINRQRLGDRVAGTIVTQRPERDPNPPPAPFLFH